MTIDYSLIGKRLAAARKNKNLTQEKLAELTSLANNYISNIENNRSIPSLETLIKLCQALEVTPNEILLGSSFSDDKYMNNELMEKLSHCTDKEKRIIDNIITILISERNK